MGYPEKIFWKNFWENWTLCFLYYIIELDKLNKNYNMKKLFLIMGLAAITAIGFGQTEWTYEMANNATKNCNGILEYTASDGSSWKVGERLTLGTASGINSFTYVSMGDGIISPLQQASPSWGGQEAEIKKIRLSGTKRQGYTLWVTCKGPLQPIHLNIEKAIEVGEVVTDGYTSNQALEELKRAKDKLDLGLITQEEFDQIKAELSQYIK